MTSLTSFTHVTWKQMKDSKLSDRSDYTSQWCQKGYDRKLWIAGIASLIEGISESMWRSMHVGVSWRVECCSKRCLDYVCFVITGSSLVTRKRSSHVDVITREHNLWKVRQLQSLRIKRRKKTTMIGQHLWTQTSLVDITLHDSDSSDLRSDWTNTSGTQIRSTCHVHKWRACPRQPITKRRCKVVSTTAVHYWRFVTWLLLLEVGPGHRPSQHSFLVKSRCTYFVQRNARAKSNEKNDRLLNETQGPYESHLITKVGPAHVGARTKALVSRSLVC